jgi:hypothetical protein
MKLSDVQRLDFRVVAAAVPLFLLIHLAAALKWHILAARSSSRLA